MSWKRSLALLLFALAAGLLLYFGWKLFWFLTDDAFIAFRYAGNSIQGYGYTWNPPPFRPVEGYTSFLWVVLLDGIWRFFGILPPHAATLLGFIFALLSLFLAAAMAWKTVQSGVNGRRFLPWAGATMMCVWLLSNRTFLAWSSSGLETAMFNFFVLLWVYWLVYPHRADRSWAWGSAFAAALIYLIRPDGLLFAGVTIAVILERFLRHPRRPEWRILAALLPLAALPIHLLWRHHRYASWLPNTYWAKSGPAWPASGWRYLASFALEYFLWIWLAVIVLAIWRRLQPRAVLAKSGTAPRRTPLIAAAILALLVHCGYYTLIIGGDHFEYRVYSHLVPLLFLSFLWAANVVFSSARSRVLLMLLFVALSLPVPWTHWTKSHVLVTRQATHMMRVPVAPGWPRPVRWYARVFDRLQEWLILHHVGMRHQEHKVFFFYWMKMFPPRSAGMKVSGDEFPVLGTHSVGIPGWTLPHVVIIDEFGLNDYVIARSPLVSPYRRMAHNLDAPDGYIESFMPNVVVANRHIRIEKRKVPLTADRIRELESYWWQYIRRNHR